MAPVEGIEPPPTVLETAVLPLYYTGTLLGGPKESRTPPTAVTGRCTNRYTMGPELDALTNCGGNYSL